MKSLDSLELVLIRQNKHAKGRRRRYQHLYSYDSGTPAEFLPDTTTDNRKRFLSASYGFEFFPTNEKQKKKRIRLKNKNQSNKNRHFATHFTLTAPFPPADQRFVSLAKAHKWTPNGFKSRFLKREESRFV
jgi:hypothetical protein